MSLSDPIGDMIARVKNAQARNHKKVELPSSNFKSKIADILKNEGFIKDFKVNSEEKKPILSLELKYHSGNPVISAFERVSKPGRRIFSSADSLPKINNGLGIAIVSTPKGVMTALLIKLLFMPQSLFEFWSTFFGLIEISFPSIMSKLNISRSTLIDFFPRGPSIFIIFPAKATFTFSGIDMLIFPILDIKIPYKLFRHQLFVFLHLYQSLLLLELKQ